jgi:protease-4
VDIKLLIGIINRPWFIEPRSAQHYAEYAANLFRGNSVPLSDRRIQYGEGFNDDRNVLFRVNKDGVTDRKGEVQVIRVNYPIAKYDLCGDPGSQSLQQIIKSVTADPSIRCTVLWMDCPGGQVDGTEALADVIKKANAEKPIVTYSDRMICSGGYWLAANTSEIIVHGANNGWNAVVGSIGTMASWEDLSGKYEKEGIRVHYVFADKSKDKWADFFKRNSGDDDAYNQLKMELNGINDSFLAAINSARGNKLSDKEDVLTGKTYNASDSLKYGLIDTIGDFQLAVKHALRLAAQVQIQQKQTQNSYSMKFPKTAAAAKAD